MKKSKKETKWATKSATTKLAGVQRHLKEDIRGFQKEAKEDKKLLKKLKAKKSA